MNLDSLHPSNKCKISLVLWTLISWIEITIFLCWNRLWMQLKYSNNSNKIIMIIIIVIILLSRILWIKVTIIKILLIIVVLILVNNCINNTRKKYARPLDSTSKLKEIISSKKFSKNMAGRPKLNLKSI